MREPNNYLAEVIGFHHFFDEGFGRANASPSVDKQYLLFQHSSVPYYTALLHYIQSAAVQSHQLKEEKIQPSTLLHHPPLPPLRPMSMLKGFFGGVSQPQDQTTPKASDQKNPFDLLSSITPSRRASQAGLPQQQQPTTTPSQQQQLQSGLKTPTLQPRTSYSGSSTPGSDGGLITPGASGSVPGTPGGRALATTGEYNSHSYRHQASRGGMDRLLNGLFGSQSDLERTFSTQFLVFSNSQLTKPRSSLALLSLHFNQSTPTNSIPETLKFDCRTRIPPNS